MFPEDADVVVCGIDPSVDTGNDEDEFAVSNDVST